MVIRRIKMVMEIGSMPCTPTPIASPIATPVTAPAVKRVIAKREAPRAQVPAPRPTGVGIGRPHVVPVPGIGPGRCYPSIIIGDVDIPVVIIEKIDIGIEWVAYRDGKLGVVEPAYAQGILIVPLRTVESIQIITVITVFIDNVILYIRFGLVGSHLFNSHSRRRAAPTIVFIDIKKVLIGRHHQRLLNRCLLSHRQRVLRNGRPNLLGLLLGSLLFFLLLHDRILGIGIIIYIVFDYIRARPGKAHQHRQYHQQGKFFYFHNHFSFVCITLLIKFIFTY